MATHICDSVKRRLKAKGTEGVYVVDAEISTAVHYGRPNDAPLEIINVNGDEQAGAIPLPIDAAAWQSLIFERKQNVGVL